MGRVQVRRGVGIGEWLEEVAAARGTRPFLRVPGDGGGLSYAGLLAGANRTANLLHALGVRPGARVAVRVPARIEAAAVLLGIARLGATAVLSGGSRPTPPEVLAASGARVAFLGEEACLQKGRLRFRERVILGAAGRTRRDELDGDALLAGAPDTAVAAVREAREGDAPLLLCIRGREEVPLSRLQVLDAALRLAERHRLRPSDAGAVLVPLDGYFGFLALLLLLLTRATGWWIPPDRGGAHGGGGGFKGGWLLGRGDTLADVAAAWGPDGGPADGPPFRLLLYPADGPAPGRLASRWAERAAPVLPPAAPEGVAAARGLLGGA